MGDARTLLSKLDCDTLNWALNHTTIEDFTMTLQGLLPASQVTKSDAIAILAASFSKCKCQAANSNLSNYRQYLEYDIRLFANGVPNLGNRYHDNISDLSFNTFNGGLRSTSFFDYVRSRWSALKNSDANTFRGKMASGCKNLLDLQGPCSANSDFTEREVFAQAFKNCFRLPDLYETELDQTTLGCPPNSQGQGNPKTLCYITNLRSMVLDAFATLGGSELALMATAANIDFAVYDAASNLASADTTSEARTNAIVGAFYNLLGYFPILGNVLSAGDIARVVYICENVN